MPRLTFEQQKNVRASDRVATVIGQMQLLWKDVFLLHDCHSIFVSTPVLGFLAHTHGGLWKQTNVTHYSYPGLYTNLRVGSYCIWWHQYQLYTCKIDGTNTEWRGSGAYLLSRILPPPTKNQNFLKTRSLSVIRREYEEVPNQFGPLARTIISRWTSERHWLLLMDPTE
jgi:hypothetical protein